VAEAGAAALAERVAAAEEPRFFFALPSPPGDGRVLFVYHCPESARPKSRMLYSTAKGAMLAAAAECGLDSIGKGAETRDRDDVLTALAELAAGAGAAGAGAGSGAAAAPSADSPASASASARHFGGVGLPGMSPLSAAAAGGGGEAAAAAPPADAGFAKPSRPGRGARTLLPTA
jgi:hypothetical protein